MWLVVGLGNPGKEYEATRHNVGFMVVDALAQQARVGFQQKFKGEIATTPLADTTVALLKPQTFMNLSGQSVQPAMAFYKIAPANVVVVHDDLDLELGTIKLKLGGSPGGHNGLKSIDQAVGPQYYRIRAGIGHPRQKAPADAPPAGRGSVVGHVLGAFKGKDADDAKVLVDHCAAAVAVLIKDGLEKAQLKFHSLRPPAR
jgi:PTH1 family peptidyl-tRNA hydrolase